MSSAIRSKVSRDLISAVSSGWACARSGNSANHGGAPRFTQGEALDHIENRRDEEDTEGAGCEHAADYGGAHNLARDGTRAGSGPQRDAAEDEGKGGHEDRAQTQAGAFESSIYERFALLIFVLCEFDDKNRVLGSETDEHDEA